MSETCRVIINQVKQKLHLVGYLLMRYYKDARYHEHKILLDVFTRITFGAQYRSLCSSLCSFLHSPVSSSLLGPIILPNTLFSNTLSLRSSLNVSDQVSYPHKATDKNYSSIYLNLCIFGWQTGRQKILHRIIARIS